MRCVFNAIDTNGSVYESIADVGKKMMMMKNMIMMVLMMRSVSFKTITILLVHYCDCYSVNNLNDLIIMGWCSRVRLCALVCE